MTLWSFVRRFGRILVAASRVLDAEHCIQEASRILPRVAQAIHHIGSPSLFEVSTAIQVIALAVWAVDALLHAYKTAKKLIDQDEEQKS